MNGQLYKVTEIAMILDVSIYTINNWYLFKRQNPDDEFAKMLPEPMQQTTRQTRYWTEEDLQKLIEFKSKIKVGRSGFMKSVSQQYSKREKKNEKKNS